MRVFLVAVGAASFLLLACGQDVGPAARDAAHTVTVRVDGPGRLLSLPPAIDCPGTCAASFPSGTSITLAATSGDGVSFAGWSGGCSGAAGCSFRVARDSEVVARFELLEAHQETRLSGRRAE